MQALACNVDWDKLDSAAVQSIIEHAKQAEITEFLLNGARLGGGGSILTIDRSTPFDPATFIGDGWSIWRGPVNGNGLGGAEQQCKKSLALTEVNIAKIRLKTCLEGKEMDVRGDRFLRRLKRGTILLLDAKIGQTLLENPNCIPEDWKKTPVYFMGTELRAPNGNRCVLYLYWIGTRWLSRGHSLGDSIDSFQPAAVGY